MGYLLIQCIAYQMHCLSNALLIKCIAYQMHCLLNALLIKYVGYSMVVKHCRRTHPFSLSLSIHRHLAYLPPARPTHTQQPHQARRPSHSSLALLSGCVRVCGREGGRVLGHAMHWPWTAAAIQRIGHTGAPAPLARLRTLRLLDRERRPGLQAHGRACICTTRHHRTLPPTTAVASVHAQHAHHRPTPHHHTPLHTTTTLDPGLSPWLQTPVNRPMDPPWRAPQPVPLGPASLPVRLRPCVCRAGAQPVSACHIPCHPSAHCM